MVEPIKSEPPSDLPETHMLPWDDHNQHLISNVHPSDWV